MRFLRAADEMHPDVLQVPPESETDFGVYVHWPFCAAKCPYCDFNSHVRHKPVDQNRYLAAFKAELAHFAERTPGRTVTSVFLGGGTPSLMEPATVAGILGEIASLWHLSDSAEISLEANPSSVEAGRFKGYRAAGVNRVSLGVQSLRDPALTKLGRLHTVKEAREAVELARSLFPRLSFDLIYARPDQTIDDWRDELSEAIALAADHLSLYQLTIENGTRFFDLYHSGRLIMPDGDSQAAFYAATQDLCHEAGLPAYEISNHAAPGAQSRHNLTYWRYQDYVGVGPGAHGRLEIGNRKIATEIEKLPEAWLDRVEASGHGIVEEVGLNPTQIADEMLLMGMRLGEGISTKRYQSLGGDALDHHRLDLLIADGLVERLPDDRIRATKDGWFVLDTVVANIAA